MKGKIQFPRRAQSLNIYKPKTIELPRFYSKPKNGIESRTTKKSQLQQQRMKKEKDKQMGKAQKVDLFSKLNEKKKQSQSKSKKMISEKKLTADFTQKGENTEKIERLKIKFKTKGNMLNAEEVQKQDKKKGHTRKFTTQRAVDHTPKQFRSKSLKNAGKIPQNACESDKIKKTNGEKNKNVIEYTSQNTTQATQIMTINNIDRKFWMRIIQILRNIPLQVGNLDWPQEYIVTDKSTYENKLYQVMQQIGAGLKQKTRKLICITRVVMYLYAGLILHQISTKALIQLFHKLHQSYSRIIDVTFANSHNFEKITVVIRNNDVLFKLLMNILAKKSIPQGNLLKNMLESSMKLESLQFIDVLDKTLKWEILKMPSFPYLPAPQKDLYLILDLDQTLIHYDYTAQVFHVRPFAEEFLKKCSEIFEVTIFTAAVQEYADEILDEIDPEHCISYKLYRNHLTYIEGAPVKDLSMLGRPLNRTLIVDNIASNYRLQPDNGIQILSWYNDDDDQILGKLFALLLKLSANFKQNLQKGIKQMQQFIVEEISKPQLIYEMKKEL